MFDVRARAPPCLSWQRCFGVFWGLLHVWLRLVVAERAHMEGEQHTSASLDACNARPDALRCAAHCNAPAAPPQCAYRLLSQVLKCKELGRAMRIGTNHGSLSARILSYYGDTPK